MHRRRTVSPTTPPTLGGTIETRTAGPSGAVSGTRKNLIIFSSTIIAFQLPSGLQTSDSNCHCALGASICVGSATIVRAFIPLSHRRHNIRHFTRADSLKKTLNNIYPLICISASKLSTCFGELNFTFLVLTVPGFSHSTVGWGVPAASHLICRSCPPLTSHTALEGITEDWPFSCTDARMTFGFVSVDRMHRARDFGV